MTAKASPRFRDLPDVDWSSFANGEVPVYNSATGKLEGQVPSGGGGGAPSGPAGGDLSGTYPDPSIGAGVIVNADVNAGAAIAEAKLALASDAAAGTASRRTLGGGATQAAPGNDARLSDQRVPTDGSVTDAKVASGAAIAKSKLASLAIVNADVDAAAAIAEAKLNLASDAAAGTASRRTLGTGALQAAAGNDPRFAAAVERAPAPAYVACRVWHTDFSNAEYDNALFTVTNFSRVTDGSTPALQPTVAANSATVMLNERLRNVDIRVRYKLTNAAGFVLENTSALLYARYLGASNNWQGQKNFATGNPVIQAQSTIAGASAGTPGVTDADVTNTTTYRYLRMQVIEDVVRMKSWFDGSPEPDWQITRRLRAPLSGAGSTTVDNVDTGQAGIAFRFTASFITELVVSELQRADDNLLWNSDLQTVDMIDNWPVFWFPASVPTSGNTLTFPTATSPDGASRTVLQALQTVDNPGGSVVWQQNLYALARPGPTAHYTRKRPSPRVHFPRVVEVSVWSKGTSVTNTGTTAAVANIYYWDKEGNAMNVGGGLGSYFNTLGPNVGGIGTWDWYRTKWRLPFVNPERIVELWCYLGLHDPTSRGTLQIADPVIRAVG